MSRLQYYVTPGFAQTLSTQNGYSQAVRIGDRIEISGQGGWSESGEWSTDINAQIDQTFVNLDLALKHAGGQGLSQVYRVNSYHVPLNNEALGAMTRNFKRWIPDHAPIWTAVGVKELAVDDMWVEIEVVAHDPEGAKATAGK